MSNTRPFTEAHAIASVDFGLLFPADLPAKTRQLIARALTKHLGKASFVPSNPDEGDLIGFERNSSADEHDLAEEVHIHDDFVHVVTYDYRGWSLTVEQLLSRLEPVFEMARQGKIAPQFVGLTFRDVFVNAQPASYSAEDVFSRQSRFLPAFSFDVGDTWRHSSWWDENSKFNATRNFLTIDSRVRKPKVGKNTHFTEITHGQRLSGNKSKTPEVTWSKEGLRSRLDQAHRGNKAVLGDLLCSDMIQQIGLEEV